MRVGKIPAIYNNIHYNTNNYLNKDCLQKNTSKVISTTLFPTFLTSTLISQENYYLKKISHVNFTGAGVSISHPETIDSFLKKYLKSNTKKNLRRSISRLEESFNITYSYYHGSITKDKFIFLLNTLRCLLQKRFHHKKMINHFLNEWDENTNNLFSLINHKKASLFVIYDDKNPISISVNRHFENTILFSECHGYNLDYSKFSLGHLDNYLLLKWCIQNKYSFLDLGNGVSDYKKKWCNTFYDFEYHIYYKKNSIIAKVIASAEINKINVKNIIKKLKIDVYFKKVKQLISKKNKSV